MLQKLILSNRFQIPIQNKNTLLFESNGIFIFKWDFFLHCTAGELEITFVTKVVFGNINRSWIKNKTEEETRLKLFA
jgi:hypothetical protein